MGEDGLKNWILRWLTTTNHKDIGILYIVTSLYFFFISGMLAMIFRVQLAAPESNIITGSDFYQAVTVHGLIMLLWFLSPFAFGLANYIVPLQIGARDLAFPRLNALSYWLYAFSGFLLLSGFFVDGAIDTGWTLYAPLSALPQYTTTGTNLGILAIALLSVSVTISTVNFLATIVKMRAPGMTWTRVPMFTWTILFTVLMMLLAFPPLLIAGVLLFLDRVIGTTFFTSLQGGALLWDHLFWFFGHPEVYILLYPGLGILADVISTFARRPLYAKRFVIIALFIAVALSYLVWIHHLFITGIGLTVRKIFSFTTAIISIPFEMTALAMIVTLYKARIKYTAPMLFSLAAIFHFIIGGATGVYQASIILDKAFRGAYWVVAHFHYIMVGTVLFALIAGMYYWLPKMTGRMYSEKLAKIQFVLAVIGLNVLYFPQFIMIDDMPRRYYDYLHFNPDLKTLNVISTIGAYIFAASLFLGAYILYKAITSGPRVSANPWGAWGLEWTIPSPPPRHNFDGTPVIRSDGSVVYVSDREISKYGLPAIMNMSVPGLDAEASGSSVNWSRETPQSTPGKGHHEGSHHEEHGSISPLVLSLGSLVALIGAGLTSVPLLLAGTIIFFLGIGKWIIEDIRGKFSEPEPKYKDDWPFIGVDKFRIGMWTFIAGESFLFGTLIGVYIFIRSRSLAWPPGYELHDPMIGLANTFILFTSALLYGLGYLSLRRGLEGRAAGFFAGTIMFASLFMAVKAIEWGELVSESYTLSSGLPLQLYYVLTGLHGAHVVAGIIATAYVMMRTLMGAYRSSKTTVLMVGIYWGMVEIVWTFLFPMFYLI
ncbi:MAG: cbb3-type cytochrome c oxidase subunit I [Desulfurococcales archaeon]|nr:cbb3-type cytochrome c oxidase subunit I [Desulfurococcales archaeon]